MQRKMCTTVSATAPGRRRKRTTIWTGIDVHTPMTIERVDIHQASARTLQLGQHTTTTTMETVQQGIDGVRKRLPSGDVHGKNQDQASALHAVDTLIDSLEREKDTLPEDPSASSAAHRAMLERANADVSEANRHSYSALNKLWRVVEKKFPTSLDTLIDPKLFSSDKCTYALDTVVLDYLLRAGHTDVAAMYSQETGVYIPETQRTAIADLHRLLSALESGNTRPILEWASANGEALRERNSLLEYHLLRSRFLDIAQGCVHLEDEAACDLVQTPTTNVHLAFMFGRRYFGPYLATQLVEIQSMYTLLLFLPKFRVSPRGVPLERSKDASKMLTYVPWKYRTLLLSLRTDVGALAAQFRKDFCALSHISQLCSLQASVDVGVNNALGRINKVRNVMKDRHNEWSQADELPVR